MLLTVLNSHNSSDIPWFLLSIEWAASLLTFVSFIPELISLKKTKSTANTSLGMYLLFSIEYLLWTIFGFSLLFYNEANSGIIAIAFIVCDLFGFILSSIILCIKIINMKRAKKFNMTEFEYDKWRYEQKQKNN